MQTPEQAHQLGLLIFLLFFVYAALLNRGSVPFTLQKEAKASMFITPCYLFRDASRITPEFLRSQGITALLLDVDNTLTAHGSQELPGHIRSWLAQMQQAGIQLAIASNNTHNRVEPSAQKLGLPYQAMCCKPLPWGLAKASKQLGVSRSQLAIVGDQLFTDRLAAALYGIRALVVLPMTEDTHKGIRFKRKLEQPFLNRYYRKGGKLL